VKIVARTQNPLSSQDELTQILSGDAKFATQVSTQLNKMTDKLFLLHKM